MQPPHRILICDDEQRIRKSLGGLLEDHGYEVVTSSNSIECLKIVATQEFDLVILDIIMPEMDGIEVLARIKEMHNAPEVIMITGYADKEKAIATFRLDAYDFIEKPFESKEILNTISHCLKQLELRRDLDKKTRELKQSEEKYRRIFDDSKDMIYVTTREGKMIDVNQAGVELFGYDSKQELLGIESVEVLYHNPGDRKPFQERIERDGFVKDYAVELKKKDGTKINVLITSTARKDEKGNVLGYEGIVRDVTEMKMALEKTARLMRAIREAKEEWEATFDAIEDAIFLVDGTYTIQRANKGVAKLVGDDFLNIVGHRCHKLIHGIDHVPAYCPRPLVVKNNCSHSAEFWEPYLNRHLRISYYPIIDGDGNVRQVIHVMRDITERQKARQEIEYLASVVRYSRDAIISTDLDCRVTSWNKAAENIFGYKEKEAVGNFIDIIVPEEQRKECHLFVEQIGEGGKIEHYETIRRTKEGRSIDMEVTLSPIKDSEGDIIGVSFIARDVTYQKQLEARLLQAQKMEAIGTLAGGIAHDFNNSLMGIQGYVSLMLLNIDPSHPHYDMLRKIEKQVQNASDLTKQLLGFARGGRYEAKPINFNELISRSSEMFGRTKKEITVFRKFEKDLWAVEVDQSQMDQVLLNLYVNAWQAMPGGGNLYLETSNVTLDESYVRPYDVEAGNYIKISVTDTGIGMDAKTKRRIFDPFFTTKEMGRGTGLGLASVYGIVSNHKGIINVYSEEGYGTTFNIYLPVSEESITPPTKTVPDEVMKGTETILLVDDEERVLDAARTMLEHLGYTVLVADRGEAAWALYQDNQDRIDLVILDIIMPDTGGGEVYDRIKALNPDVKVILSSGYSFNDKASEILERGANSFIQKPYGIKDLSHKVREVIDAS